jgi:hypothetical protein
MNFVVKSFDGHLLNTATLQTWVPRDALLGGYGAVIEVERSGYFPVMAGKRLGGRSIPLTINMLSNPNTQIDDLLEWFDVSKNNCDLVITDIDSGTDWTVQATPNSMVSKKHNIAKLTLWVSEPIWQSSTKYSNWTVTASGQKKVVPVGGRMSVSPKLTISPQAPKTGGYAKRIYVPVVNRTNAAADTYPYEVAGGLNTTALVGAGLMQSSGNDWRLSVDGVEVDCWKVLVPSTASKMWANFRFSPRIALTLLGSIPSSGAVTEINIKFTTTNKTAAANLAKVTRKNLLIENEVFSFTNVVIAGNTIKITGVSRAQFTTAPAAHADNTDVEWLEHEVWMLHGNASAGAQEVDDTKKPLLDLSLSTNTSWVLSPLRDLNRTSPFQVMPSKVKPVSSPSTYYTDTHGGDANPATVIGMKIANWQINGQWRGETAEIQALFTHPFGITTVSATGEKYKNTVSWPAVAALQKMVNGRWTTVWNEVAPSTLSLWTALAPHSGVSLVTTILQIRFVLSGSVGATANSLAMFEINAVTLGLDSAKTPRLVILAGVDNYYLDLQLENETTGKSLYVKSPCGIGDVFSFDADARTITLNGQTLQTGVMSGDWPELQVGNNTFEFIDAGTADVDLQFQWKELRVL